MSLRDPAGEMRLELNSLMDAARTLWWARFSGCNLESSKTPPTEASQDNTLSSSINVLLAFGPSPLEMANKERTREINFFLILPFQQGPDPRLLPVPAPSRARPYFTLNHQFLGEQGTTPWGMDGHPISRESTAAVQT